MISYHLFYTVNFLYQLCTHVTKLHSRQPYNVYPLKVLFTATIYGNGQRLGVITNLTIEEFEIREESYSEEYGDVVVIPCVYHKTGSQGLAYLVISEEIDDMIQYYYENIRRNITPADNCDKYLFVTRSGD